MSTEQVSDSTTEHRSSKKGLRLFWVGMAVFLIVMVLLGFGSTYGRQLVLGKEISGAGVVETDWVIHLHAAVFVGWMGFLLAQTILAARGWTRVHMALGKYGGTALAVTLVVTGSLINYVQAQAAVSGGHLTWVEVPAFPPWADLLTCIALLGLGFLYRRRPPLHKRYMVLATIMIAIPATFRMGYLLGPSSSILGNIIMVAPLFVYDLYTESSIHTATLCGTGILALRFAAVRVAESLVLQPSGSTRDPGNRKAPLCGPGAHAARNSISNCISQPNP